MVNGRHKRLLTSFLTVALIKMFIQAETFNFTPTTVQRDREREGEGERERGKKRDRGGVD